MTNCEKAFLAYFETVSPGLRDSGGHGPISDDTILTTWHEFFTDWCAAVEWGQKNPYATTKPSCVRKRRLEPKFLNTMDDSWEEQSWQADRED